MIPKESLNKEMNNSDTINPSTAYTFLDSYIYMKNSRYNALYEKNKEMLAIEKEALANESVGALYYAATEQTKMLNSVIVRIRNYTQVIRNDVIQNLLHIIPDPDDIRDFEEAISSIADIPKQKVVKYEIHSIEYPNMAVFYTLFAKEMREFARIHNDGANLSNPFPHNVATKFLVKSTSEYAKTNVDILSTEDFYITTVPELNRIKDYFKKKSMILTAVNKDFRTFYFYLRQYRMLDQVLRTIKPTVLEDGRIKIGDISDPLESFNDYLVIYRHYSMMIKYLMDTVSTFDAKFFNKIYAIQSNIEMYRAIMNYTVTYYKTRSRNIEEAFEDIGTLISGQDNVKSFLNDNADDIPEDTIKDVEVPQSEIEYPEDAYDYKEDDLGDIDYIEDDEDFKIDDDFEIDDLDYDDLVHKEDEIRNNLDNIYESSDVRSIENLRNTILQEAAVEKQKLEFILNGIIDAIKIANAKFKESAKSLSQDNADVIQQAHDLDISTMDLTGVEFDMFNYPKGVDVMHRIKIPSYKMDDDDLLTEDNALGFKEKYFKDIYYFSYKDVPLNRNKFRGSQAKKLIEANKIADTYRFFVNYIDNYGNIVNTINNANKRIISVMTTRKRALEKAYGETEELTESIIFNRSIYRSDYISLLLEDSAENVAEDIGDILDGYKPDGVVNGPKKDREEQQTEAPAEEASKETEPKEEKPKIDDIAADKANDALEVSEAMRQYCRITYEVNSTRMDIYEEIYDTALKFIKMLIDSTKK